MPEMACWEGLRLQQAFAVGVLLPMPAGVRFELAATEEKAGEDSQSQER